MAIPFISSFTPGSSRNDFTGFVGADFVSPGVDIWITDVGRWVMYGDTHTHEVYILHTGPDPHPIYAHATVATLGVAANSFSYAAITPIRVPFGTTLMIVSQEINGEDHWFNRPLSAVTSPGGCTITGSEFVAGTDPLAIPYNGQVGGPFGPPNFLYSLTEPAPIPDVCSPAWLEINEPGNGLGPNGTWTPRVNDFGGSITLKTFDSRGTVGGIYNANLTWPSSCIGVNQGILLALSSVNPVNLIQAVSDYKGGSFTSYALKFLSPNAAGNTLIVDISFEAGSYTAGPVSITDSQGNMYTQASLGNPAFQGNFLQSWFVPSCAAGANTVTISIAGAYPFTALSVAIHEYSGVAGIAEGNQYGCGPVFGTGSPVNLSVSPSVATLLHLVTSTNAACPGATVGGGGTAPNVWTNQSHRLHTSESISFSWIVRQRGTAKVPLTIAGNDDYIPTIGSQVCLWDITAAADFEVFSGTIDDYEVKWLGGQGERIVTLTCVSLEQVFDTIRLPSLLFTDQTAAFIFTALFAYAAGSPVTLGTVTAPLLISQFLVADYPTIADCFTRLATLIQGVWGVDPGTGSVYLTPPNVTPSPFTLDAEDVLWEQFTLKEERHDKRNKQILKVNANAAVSSSEYFQGSGQSSFTMLRPVDQITNAWLTQNTQNFTLGTFTGQPSAGDTITVGYASTSGSSFNWHANSAFVLGSIIVDSNGWFQKVTAVPPLGKTGATEPVWIEILGQVTTDNLVEWTNQGPAGFADGNAADYTFVAALDNREFGQVLIGASLTATILNLWHAINSIQEFAGVTFSFPTWENPLLNADTPTSTTLIVRSKAAGQGFIASLAWTGSVFSFDSDVTHGGVTTFGTNVITFGVEGQTTGGSIFTIVYNPGSNIIKSATPLQPGNNLQIEYKASNTGYVIVEDTADVIERARIEDGTGKYQQSSSDDSALSLPQGLQLAQQQLAAFDTIPKTFTFTTMVAGLCTGQVLAISMASPSNAPTLINASWFIQEIQGEVVPVYGENGASDRWLPGGGHFRYTVTCIDVAQIGSWLDFWMGLGGGGSSGGSSVAAGGGSLGPNTGFPQNFFGQNVDGHTFAAGDGFGFDLANFDSCSAVGASFTGRFFGAIFKNATLTNATFNGDFEACDFSASGLTGCTFVGRFLNCIFDNASGTGMIGASANFTGSTFANAGWQGDFHLAIFAGVSVPNTVFDGSNFQGTSWSGVAFSGSVMSGTDFGDSGAVHSILTGTSWFACQLNSTLFTNSNLAGASFLQCGGGVAPTFTGAMLTGVRFNDMNSGQYELVLPVIVSYAVKSWDANKVISASGAGVTITLPDPCVSDTWQCAVLNTDPTNGVSVDPGSLTINGVAGVATVAPGAALQIFSDGTNYFAF